MKFKTQFNAKEFPAEYESAPVKLPSQTIPDQTMSVKQILERYAQGRAVMGQEGQYYGENEFPDVDKMDLSERMELRDAAREQTRQIQSDLQEQERKRKTPPKPEPKPLDQEEIPFEEVPKPKKEKDEKK